MERKMGQRLIHTYHLTPGQLEELHKRFGQPGEMSPGQPAPKKRNRLDKTLAALDRKEKNAILPLNEGNEGIDLVYNLTH